MKKTITGTVISTKNAKTVVVRVVRKLRHPLYRKVVTRHKNFKAHVEIAGVTVGDTVSIQDCTPVSKDKRFIVTEKITIA